MASIHCEQQYVLQRFPVFVMQRNQDFHAVISFLTTSDWEKLKIQVWKHLRRSWKQFVTSVAKRFMRESLVRDIFIMEACN